MALTEKQAAMAGEALNRATQGESVANFAAIYEGFGAMGISTDDIWPRDNVLTYHAWRAKGRQVERGQHGVKIVTYVTMTKTQATGQSETFRRPRKVTVFHISQTKAIEAAA